MPRTDEAYTALAAIQEGGTPRALESQTLAFKEQGSSEGEPASQIRLAD